MAVQQIPNLPAAIALAGSEQLEAVQAGVSVRVTSAQIALLASPFSGNPLAPTMGGTGTGTVFTTGSVVFAGASGVYQQNNTNFFWDNVNFRLGVGNNAPSYNLDITGTFRSTGNSLVGGTLGVTGALTLGTQQTTQGSIVLANIAGGAFSTTIKSSNSASAAWTFTLPATAGTNNYILTTDGSGVTSWTNPTALGIDLDVGSTAITSGTSGRVLYDNAGVLGEYTVTGTAGSVVLSASPTITTPTLSGNVTSTGTGARFLGDFTNATITNRLAFQTSASNSSTGVYALPAGSSTAASWQATNNSDPTNASKILIATNGATDVQLVSGINGAGAYLPLSVLTNGSQTAQFSTTVGTFSLGVAGASQGILNLNGATSGTVSIKGAAVAGTWSLTLPATGGTNNYALTTNGSGVTSWSQISLTAGVTGVLPVANGGTNASSASITAFNNITGYTATGATGTTSTNLVFSTAPTLTGVVLAAGTNSVAPLTLTSGTNLTTAAAGAIEYDGKLSYFTPASTARALTPSMYYYRNNSAVTLASATGNQSILGTTSGVTLQASTIYEVEGGFELTTTGITSHTESIGFALTTATVTAMGVDIERFTISATATGTTGAYLTTVTPVAVTGAITTAQTVTYYVRGTIAIGTGGQVNPVIAFSAGPGGTSTIVAGAWFRFFPVGTTGSNVSIGTWA